MTDRERAQGEPLGLVGLAEAPWLLGISKSTLCGRRRRRPRADWLPPFPPPVAELKCGPVWFREQIVADAHAAEEVACDRRYERFAEEQAALTSVLFGLRPEEEGESG